MRMWKAALKTEVDGANDVLREQARAYCFEQGLVGLGWYVGQLVPPTTDPHIYENAVAANRDALATDRFWNVRNCLGNHRRFVAAETGDLVWTRSPVTQYWIGKIRGPWHYDHDAVRTGFDLNQWRECSWYNVGDAANVPGAIRNQFAGPGGSFTEIRSGGPTLAWLSSRIYEEMSGDLLNWPAPENADVMANIGHDDLEDIVGFYLQQVRGWRVVMTTAKHATPTTECTLKSDEGATAWLQVKSGTARVPDIISLPGEVLKFFVVEATPKFRVDAQPAALRHLIEVVSPAVLVEWCLQHRAMLPRPVQLLLDLQGPLPN